jgi:hypothetical protein
MRIKEGSCWRLQKTGVVWGSPKGNCKQRQEGIKMKKWILIVITGLFLAGCLSAKKSEFMQHDSTFKDWDHMKYSLWGYQNPSEETVKKSQEEGWWGTEVPHIPAQ